MCQADKIKMQGLENSSTSFLIPVLFFLLASISKWISYEFSELIIYNGGRQADLYLKVFMYNITGPTLEFSLWSKATVLAPLHSCLCTQQEEGYTLLIPWGQCQVTDQREQSEVYRQLRGHSQLLEATQELREKGGLFM